jgi:molybdate transport system regulatory protein
VHVRDKSLSTAESKILRSVFNIKRNNFFIVFRRLALSIGIPKDLAHPHIVRHNRAIELLRASISVTAVQQILEHASLNTTAMYLKYSTIEVKTITKDRGLI